MNKEDYPCEGQSTLYLTTIKDFLLHKLYQRNTLSS